MADAPKKLDGLDNAVLQNDTYVVGPHRKLLFDHAYISVPKKGEMESRYPTFMDIAREDGCRALKDIFAAAAGAARTVSENNHSIFWLLNVTDDRVTPLNLTHSQGSTPHMHIVTGALPDGYRHIGEEEPSFTPRPRKDFQEALAQRETLFTKMDQVGPFTVYNVPEAYAESETHIVITADQFTDFVDFTERATDADYAALQTVLQTHLGAQIEKGGARLINDDKFRPAGSFTLRIQGGDQGHRWFEKAGGPAP